ncbi:hypothetical protein [Clostridium baratii]|uniref:hypothetical protein n=1 Tax=Clostridium baratii TaxID=1561 RepID=UPI00097FBC5B|nr:hypothetical protein [Clostridium baratii]AQM61475.1 hypothetical protein NPD11_872 [Clostridium baratii]
MNKLVKDTLKRIYIDKDYEYFKNKCNTEIQLSKELLKKIEKFIKNVDKENMEGFPSQRWYFEYEKYKSDKFEITYRSILIISKIIPVFYIQHEFEVESYDPDRIFPTLDGFNMRPYTKTQSDLEEVVKEYLHKEGYSELMYPDLDELVLSKKKNDVNILDGDKYSLEGLMFIGTFDM